MNNQRLSIIHINDRSMFAKLGQIDLLLKSTQGDFDILAVSEIWESVNNTYLLNIAGYRKMSHARPLDGDVAMFIKESLKVVRLINITNNMV